jgi:hypothetical protein
MHKTTLIKVNAWVDEGIAPLVFALNDIPGVVTLDSCQEAESGWALTFFAYGRDWKDTGNLLQGLSSLLATERLPCGYAMKLSWLGSNDRARGQIMVRPDDVTALANGIRRIIPQLTELLRSSPCGTSGKGPDSYPACRGLPLIPA